MLSSNPLTASIDIQKAASTFKPLAKVTPETVNEKKLGEFADDILNISTLGHEKQQKEIQLEASQKINDIANDVIRVSSSIGKARILGNLTNSQATNLYNKISALL
ncbi:MAG: hypothetical protein QNK36_13850 [Colwellia sp.]|nr:hypothetical protein [Colwellia sp.]